MIHNGMPYDLIQCQGHGGQKLQKWLIVGLIFFLVTEATERELLACKSVKS